MLSLAVLHISITSAECVVHEPAALLDLFIGVALRYLFRKIQQSLASRCCTAHVTIPLRQMSPLYGNLSKSGHCCFDTRLSLGRHCVCEACGSTIVLKRFRGYRALTLRKACWTTESILFGMPAQGALTSSPE